MAKAFIASRKIALHSTHNAHIASKIMSSQLLLRCICCFSASHTQTSSQQKSQRKYHERWKKKCWLIKHSCWVRNDWHYFRIVSHTNQWVYASCVSNTWSIWSLHFQWGDFEVHIPFISIFKKISHASKECKKIAHFMIWFGLNLLPCLRTLQHNFSLKSIWLTVKIFSLVESLDSKALLRHRLTKIQT